MQNLPPGFARSVAVETIVGQMTGDDLSTTGAALEQLPSSAVGDDALCSYASRWAQKDAEAALMWAASRPPSPLRSQLMASIGYELSNLNPNVVQHLANAITVESDRALFLESNRLSKLGVVVKGSGAEAHDAF